jgi:hypothetical protein
VREGREGARLEPEGFLKPDGIAGESGDPAHAGEIDVESFAFGAKNAPVAGGGGGAGKPAFSALTFSKLYDAGSPKLFQSLVTGEHVASATFSLRRPVHDRVGREGRQGRLAASAAGWSLLPPQRGEVITARI